MKKWIKRIAYFLLLGLIIIQFFPGEKPAVSADNPGDIHNEVLVNPEVSGILKAACYDCHSNETNYPWYASVAPVSWLVIHDTNEGRDELNFSEWATYSAKRKHHKLEEVIEMVEEGEMPLAVYNITHPEGRLTDAQIEALISWAKARMEEITL
ncbi:heme-binding domain-containing protein [Marinoscillum luteum]|uniref:Heme-binding domain-containing protein n=1 Tax=Marinoscillum luteum TaxID=861051 RepID=A0ABW7ND05_9BACT